MIGPMSPSEFQNVLNYYLDFHRSYLFRVMFFDGTIGALTGSLVTNLISATDTPISTTGAINLGWQGSKVKIAGKTDYPDWKVTIRDDAVNVAHTYFQDWRDKVYNLKTGTSSDITSFGTLVGSSTGYKKSAIVILLANNIINSPGLIGEALNTLSSSSTIRAYLLNNVWPKEIGTITLDYSTENIATFPVSFSIDSFEPYSIASAASNALSNLLKI